MMKIKQISYAILKNILLFLLVTSPVYFIPLYKIIVLHETSFIHFRLEGELLNLVLFIPFIIISSFFSRKVFKTVLSISIILMALIVFIEIEMLFLLDRYFSTDIMYDILATNPQESKEFYHTFFSMKVITTQIILVLVYIIYCCLAIYFITKIRFPQKRNFKFTSIIMLAIFPIYHLSNHHRTTKNVLTQNTLYFIANGLTNGRLSIQDNHQNIYTNYTAVANDKNSKQLVVFILGESQTKNHVGLYGYHRNTMPKLQKLHDENKITVFNNVITSESSTAPSMRNMFFEQGYETKPRINIMAAFNSAGFKNYYIENQFVKTTYTDTLISKNNKPKHTTDYGFALVTNTMKDFSNRYIAPNAKYDQAIVTGLHKILKRKDNKIFMILHLRGNHFQYNNRYPKNFDIYHKPIKILQDMDKISHSQYGSRVENANHYDNSIVYNDYILSEIINYISTMEDHDSYEISIVYAPDHGEATARTGDGTHFLHGILTDKDIFEIPLFLWTNSTFKKNHPDIIQTSKENINSPYITDQIGFSLFHLASIQLYNKHKKIDIMQKSIFSNSLNTNRIRKIGFHSGSTNGVDYDKILKPQKDLYK